MKNVFYLTDDGVQHSSAVGVVTEKQYYTAKVKADVQKSNDWTDYYKHHPEGDGTLSEAQYDAAKLEENKKKAVQWMQIYQHVPPVVRLYKDAYNAAGLSEQMTAYNIVQDYMESGGYTNNGYNQGNPGNIMWPDKGGLKHGKRGTYNSNNHTYYAAFASPADFVAEKIVLLNKKPGIPIMATSIGDFVSRLGKNGYYGSQTAASYLTAINNANNSLHLLSMAPDNFDLGTIPAHVDPMPKKGFKDWWDSLPWYEQAGIEVGGGLMVFLLIKSMLK